MGLAVVNPTASQWFWMQAFVYRTGATAQVGITLFTVNGAATTSSKTVPAETPSS